MKKITMMEPLEDLLPKMQAIDGEGYLKAIEIINSKTGKEREELLKKFHTLELEVSDDVVANLLEKEPLTEQ